jgi:hypothetical protein
MPPILKYKTTDIALSTSKKLFGGQVYDGMPLNNIICIISALFDKVFQQVGYDCIDLKLLGIECLDENADKKCVILNWIIEKVNQNGTDISNINTVLQIIQTALGQFNDERVKVRAAGTAQYLEDLIQAPPGNIEYADNSITFMGFVPIGFCATINPNRINDFDVTGKGKVNTDLWGWAIRNGSNGTQKVLDLFPRYAANPNTAGAIAGALDFTVDKTNIKTMTIPVTGVINDSLDNGKRLPSGGPFGIKGGVDFQSYFVQDYNLKHAHGFSLTATHTNPNATPIPLIPKHITEIPIERIIP